MSRKIVGGLIAAYGLFYLLFSHEVHQKYGIDWLVGNWFNWGGFPHYIHLILGAALTLYGILLFTGKLKTPKFLSKLYGAKKEY